MPTFKTRSWWDNWGDTNDVQECIDPSTPDPIVPPVVVIDTEKYQPLIDDLLIFETNKIEIYFIA
jgi:hypothetical protein